MVPAGHPTAPKSLIWMCSSIAPGKSPFYLHLEDRRSAFLRPIQTKCSKIQTGRFISAFTNSTTELMLFDTKTRHWSSLVKGQDFGYNLWSHDGKYVYMRESSKGSPRLVRV